MGIVSIIRKHFQISDLSKRLSKACLDSFGDNLISIVLFGSQARGEADPRSDYDLLVIAERLPVSPLERLEYVRRPITGRFDEKISIIARTKKEIESGFPSLYLDIGLDGIIIYDRNYFRGKLHFIRQLIKSAGLVRLRENKEFYWKWNKQPKFGWALDWSGFHALP